jgi:hypothetical protein
LRVHVNATFQILESTALTSFQAEMPLSVVLGAVLPHLVSFLLPPCSVSSSGPAMVTLFRWAF